MKTKLRNQKGSILSQSKGFTIIEVLIVLAIAGLILLIVFLAVPALQRNSRNTQRKNDVAALLGAVSEFSNNNNGAAPTVITSPSAGVVQFGCGAGSCTTSQAKVGYYNAGVGNTPGKVEFVTPYGGRGPSSAPQFDYVSIITGADCNGTSGQSKPGSTRQVAAVYEIENGSGTYGPVCQSS